jgi:hypothetical protein
MTEDTKLLDENELKVTKELLSKETPRTANIALDIVGAAAYIDGARSQEEYVKLAQLSNPSLRNKYEFIYKKLILYLQNKIKREYTDENNPKCVYAADRTKDKVALPGFHIFTANSPLARGWAVASVHVDKQELQVPWKEVTNETFDMIKTLSYTLAISVPPDSGLYIMDRKEVNLNGSLTPLWLKLRNSRTEKIEYENGHCYMHHGKYFHMISPFYAKDNSSTRITLQGHALYCTSRKEWWLYW